MIEKNKNNIDSISPVKILSYKSQQLNILQMMTSWPHFLDANQEELQNKADITFFSDLLLSSQKFLQAAVAWPSWQPWEHVTGIRG